MYASADPAGVAAGIISMWHGLITAIPSDWHLCDGTNGTPDLRSSFVRGAPAATEAGTTGGADTHTLTIGEMPSHQHNISVNDSAAARTTVCGSTSANPTLVSGEFAGGGSAHNNMPAYYEVLYIMKG